MIVITQCPCCKQTQGIRVNQPGYEAWLRGKSIQEALPKLKPEQREALISGYCKTCWDKLFGGEDND